MIFNNEPQNWKELQDFVGKLFSECGFKTEVSKTVELVRGNKEIDVYAEDIQDNNTFKILVECKFWNKSVSQETIHSFRTIMEDFGANLGFIVSKEGFQSGAYEAVQNTNLNLVSLDDLEEKYYLRWKDKMFEKLLPFSDVLFPYWDFPGKPIIDSGTISLEKKNLIHNAYRPICSLGPLDKMKGGFKRDYPIIVPTINDSLEITGEEKINNDREYFDFVIKNKDNALKHFRILYREI